MDSNASDLLAATLKEAIRNTDRDDSSVKECENKIIELSEQIESAKRSQLKFYDNKEATVDSRKTRLSKQSDWTATYQLYDKFVDVEELEWRKTTELNNLEKLKEQQSNYMGHEHDHASEKALFEKPEIEKISLCEQYSIFGENYFIQGNYIESLQQYKTALGVSEYIFPEDEKTAKRLQRLRDNSLCNISNTLCHLNHYRDAVNYINMVISETPSDVALSIRGYIYRKMNEYE